MIHKPTPKPLLHRVASTVLSAVLGINRTPQQLIRGECGFVGTYWGEFVSRCKVPSYCSSTVRYTDFLQALDFKLNHGVLFWLRKERSSERELDSMNALLEHLMPYIACHGDDDIIKSDEPLLNTPEGYRNVFARITFDTSLYGKVFVREVGVYWSYTEDDPGYYALQKHRNRLSDFIPVSALYPNLYVHKHRHTMYSDNYIHYTYDAQHNEFPERTPGYDALETFRLLYELAPVSQNLTEAWRATLLFHVPIEGAL